MKNQKGGGVNFWEICDKEFENVNQPTKLLQPTGLLRKHGAEGYGYDTVSDHGYTSVSKNVFLWSFNIFQKFQRIIKAGLNALL